MALFSLCLPRMLAQSTGALVAVGPLGDKSSCVATPTELILAPKPPARLWIFLFLFIFLRLMPLSVHSNRKPSFLPLASRAGPGASGRRLRVRKRARTFPGNRGVSPRRLRTRSPRKAPVVPEGTRLGPRSYPPPPPPNPGGDPSKHPVHSARQAPRPSP